MTDNLLALLQEQVRARPDEVALRRKSRGIWRELNWQKLASEVERAARIADAGTLHADDASPESLVLALAASGATDALVDPARVWLRAAGLGPHDEVLALPGLRLESYVRHLLPAWLLSGFTLNFAEDDSTSDGDRRELGPSAVVGTAHSLEQLKKRVLDNLPSTDGVFDRFVLNALSATSGPAAWFGSWLVKPRLRDVIGLSRVTRLVVIGAPPAGDVFAFYAKLGISARVSLLESASGFRDVGLLDLPVPEATPALAGAS